MESTDLTQQLPDDLLVAILRRLQPHGLVAARCVCKAWHAVIDDLCLLDLFPSSLAGFFINYHDLEISEFFFRPRRRDGAMISGELHYVSLEEYDDTLVKDHCNGLLLFWSYVVNPATRQWAPLPTLLPDLDVHPSYIAFDPAVSPHYEVLKIPQLPHNGIERQLEWPPSPYSLHVFSSVMGNWEARSFARRGDAIGTVSHLRELRKPSIMRKHSAYWQGHLYVLDQFVMRISLANCTYQAFQPPVHVDTSYKEICLGRSENGVYFASLDPQHRLRVWILNESFDEIEWVLRHDNSLDDMLSHGMYDWKVKGPWIMEDINYSSYGSTSPINMKEEGDTSEWNSDNENTLDTGLRVRKDIGFSILGFHPYKEIIFLSEFVHRGLAYHLHNPKIEDLGNIYPKHYVSMFKSITQSFPYAPCWRKLPGSI